MVSYVSIFVVIKTRFATRAPSCLGDQPRRRIYGGSRVCRREARARFISMRREIDGNRSDEGKNKKTHKYALLPFVVPVMCWT